jgi:plastocyanin
VATDRISATRRALLLVCLLLVAVLAGCGSSSKPRASNGGNGGTSGEANTIVIKNFTFSVPASVKAGSTVTVKNTDSTAHTVTADDNSFNTGPIDGGKSATITVSKAGTVKFHCNIHNYMTGTLNVTS